MPIDLGQFNDWDLRSNTMTLDSFMTICTTHVPHWWWYWWITIICILVHPATSASKKWRRLEKLQQPKVSCYLSISPISGHPVILVSACQWQHTMHLESCILVHPATSASQKWRGLVSWASLRSRAIRWSWRQLVSDGIPSILFTSQLRLQPSRIVKMSIT